MSSTYPPEITRFIEDEMSSGKFANEAELIARALAVYRELKDGHAELRVKIAEAIEDENAGRVGSLNVEEIIAELESELDEQGQTI